MGHFWKVAASALTALLVITSVAKASPVSAEQLLRDYNVIVFGELSGSIHTHGGVYVGGDLTASGPYEVNKDHEANSVTHGASLVVGGDITGNARLFGGHALIGATPISGTLDLQGASTASYGNAIDTAAVQSALTGFSASLSGLADTGGTLTGDMNNRVFNAVAGADGVAVFNITAGFLESNNGISFSDSSTLTIVNVSGADFTQPGSMNFNGAYQNVIFNFFEATTVTFSNNWGASVLAPLAHVITGNGGRMNGTVVAGSLHQGKEIDYQFTGDFPDTPVPIPGSVAFMLTGLSGLIFVMRRRRNEAMPLTS